MNDAMIVSMTDPTDQLDELLASFYLNVEPADYGGYSYSNGATADVDIDVEQEEDAALYDLYSTRTEQPPTPHSGLTPRYGLQQLPTMSDRDSEKDALAQLEYVLQMAFAAQESLECYDDVGYLLDDEPETSVLAGSSQQIVQAEGELFAPTAAPACLRYGKN
ncbi:hypothetical protein AX16_007354 [Volvariella volvacea WC 439]|nr:hypothetical protein AX16_007354 [Volvariella volvacea WC 439]